MVSIINIVAAIILIVWTLVSLSGYRVVTNPLDSREQVKIGPMTRFLTMSVMTSMVFLGPYSMIKYGWWIILLVILAIKDFKYKINLPIVTYIIFIAWAAYSALFIAPYKGAAFNMLIKYILPLGYLYLGYNAITDEEDLVYFLKRSALAIIVYTFLVGGFAEKCLNPLYNFLALETGLLLSYGPMADFISATFVIIFTLYVITGKTAWLMALLWCVLSTLLANVRTGMGGIFLATIFFLFLIFKYRSIPWITGISIAGIIIVFSIPQFREKMFVDKDLTISEFRINDANFETINSNNREFMWTRNLDEFFTPHPVAGSGLGIAVETMKRKNALLPEKDQSLVLLHSDYIQFLCDLGIIGLTLFIIFGVTTIVWIIKMTWKSKSLFSITLCGGMALGTFAAIFFSMAYDNIISYAQQCYVFPFIYLGILMRFLEKEMSQNKLS